MKKNYTPNFKLDGIFRYMLEKLIISIFASKVFSSILLKRKVIIVIICRFKNRTYKTILYKRKEETFTKQPN